MDRQEAADRPANASRLQQVDRAICGPDVLHLTACRLNEAVIAGNVGLWDWDLLTDKVYYSPQWKWQIGYEDHEIGDSVEEWRRRLHPDERAAIIQRAGETIAPGGPDLATEFRFRHKDGSYRWILAHGSVQRDARGQAVRLLGSHVDITSQKQTEQALRESEERFRRLVHWSPMSILMLRQGKYVYANPAAARLLGYGDAEQIIGLEAIQTIAPEHREIIRDRMARIEASEHNPAIEMKLVRPDGSTFWALSSSVSVVMEGVPTAIIVGQDITDRKAQTQRIALLGQMLDEAPASITVHDERGIFHYANRQTLVLHGYEDADQFLATNLKELDTPETAAVIDPRMRQIAEQGQARFEVTHRRPDGSTFLLEVVAKAAEWDGQPAILSVASDITERKQAERDLRESESRYRALVMQSADCMILHDLEGRIVDVNAASCRTYGYSREELLTMHVGDLDPDYDRRADHGAFYQNMQPGHAAEFQARQRRRDGRIFPVEVRLMLVEIQGQTFIQGLCRDITERHEHEQRQRLLMRELDHRVKNNLAAVQGLVHATLRSAKSLDGFCDAFFGRLTSMARTHEALARTRWEGIDLREAVLMAIAAYLDHGHSRVTMEGPDIQLTSRCAQPITLAVHELGVNAIKHGSLSRATGRVDVSWTQSGDRHVSLCWRESGGPVIVPPEQPAGGISLIEGLIAHELGGQVEVTFAPEGLICNISIPAAVAPLPLSP